MAAEQDHGTQFEHLVLSQSGLYTQGAYTESPTSRNDGLMEHTHDGIALSIKTVQWDMGGAAARPVIALADACRFYASTTQDALRVVVGLHSPTTAGPVVYEIHECVLTPEMEAGLWGDIQEETLSQFAKDIKAWAKEDDNNNIVGRKIACEKARQRKRAILPQLGHIDINPKISAQEARLQCSVPLFALRRECLNAGSYASFASLLRGDRSWRTLTLPIQLSAGNRQTKNEKK